MDLPTIEEWDRALKEHGEFLIEMVAPPCLEILLEKHPYLLDAFKAVNAYRIEGLYVDGARNLTDAEIVKDIISTYREWKRYQRP